MGAAKQYSIFLALKFANVRLLQRCSASNLVLGDKGKKEDPRNIVRSCLTIAIRQSLDVNNPTTVGSCSATVLYID